MSYGSPSTIHLLLLNLLSIAPDLSAALVCLQLWDCVYLMINIVTALFETQNSRLVLHCDKLLIDGKDSRVKHAY